MTHPLCGSSSLLPLKDGVVPTCFQNIILYGANSLFIFIAGSFRIKELLNTPKQEIKNTRLQYSKIISCVILAALPLIRSFGHLVEGDAVLDALLADFYICLSWLFCMLIAMMEYARAQRNNWAVRVFWTSSFVLASGALQTTLYEARSLKMGFGIDFFVTLIFFIFTIYLCSIGLYFNRIPAEYERLLDNADNMVDVTFDKKV